MRQLPAVVTITVFRPESVSSHLRIIWVFDHAYQSVSDLVSSSMRLALEYGSQPSSFGVPIMHTAIFWTGYAVGKVSLLVLPSVEDEDSVTRKLVTVHFPGHREFVY